MAMNADTESKVNEYIQQKEESEWNSGILDTVADLAWLEKETKDKWHFFKWLRNDENLLTYANLTMDSENLSFWDSVKRKLLELKLSITCKYFPDFKDFLAELKRWTNTNTETTNESTETWNHIYCWTNVNSIKSEPYEKNSKTWVTWCSKTARWNWKNFGIELPSWNAYNAWELPWKNCIKTIPEDKRDKLPKNNWKWIEFSAFKFLTRWNYADIYTSSKSDYGHRAAAFKDDSWQRYVLDPYTRVKWIMDNSPKKLEDYLSVRKVVKAHIYESNWYKESGSDTYDDEWKGYEWWTK